VAKKSASVVATAISAVKAAEQKKKRKRRAASPPAVATPTIPTPRSREVGSEDEEEEKEKEMDEDEAIEELLVPEDQAAERQESPTAKRQQELVQKTSEEALQRVLEAQRGAAAVRAKIPAAIKPRVFWLKTRLPAAPRYGLKSCCYLCAFYLNTILTWYFSMQAGGKTTRCAGYSSISPRTRSLEPHVTGEALVDDARTATPTRGVEEGVMTSPPVTDTKAGSSLHTLKVLRPQLGESGRRPPQQS
jgi:hypothetical protein